MNEVVIAGKYFLLHRIAAGGMAEVWLAKQQGWDGFEKLVVIKQILPHLAENTEYEQMFLDEARMAADLRHNNVVSTFEIGEEQGSYYMAMEFLNGYDLRALVETFKKNRHIPYQIAVGIAKEACSGLHYAHTKKDLNGKKLSIIHRDVSPQNIIVTFEGLTKIVDFGIAKAVNQTSETLSGVLKGKYSYMSPEQAAGKIIDHRSDQFSLGIILYELTTMRRLFKRENEISTHQAIMRCDVKRPSKFIKDYPSRLESIVMKALSKNPRDRFSGCWEFNGALEEFLLHENYVHTPKKLKDFMRLVYGKNATKVPIFAKMSRSGVKSHLSSKHFEKLPASGSLKSESGQGRHTLATTSTGKFPFKTQMGFVAMLGGTLGVVIIILALSLIPKEAFLLALSGGGAFDVNTGKGLVDLKNTGAHENVLNNKRQLPIGLESEVRTRLVLSKKPKKAASGRLKIVVTPWANVFLNGQKIGFTPLSPRILVPGKYTLKLENPILKKKIIRVFEIRPGQDTIVRHYW